MKAGKREGCTKLTIIKQQAVTTSGHQKNLRNYINNDKKVLARSSLNMEGCPDLKRWASFMSATRDLYGHNEAARRNSKNTILYHQIIAFNPDECDLNGGSLTPEKCMEFAKEYVSKFYSEYQSVMALHNEYCREDKTHRYAVHIVVNRSNLKTGKRLNEGRGRDAKIARANRMKDMDRIWGLKQVQEGKVNSKTHARQPSRIEKEIAKRGGHSFKTNLRALCQLASSNTNDIYSFRELLESWGVEVTFRHGKMLVTDEDHKHLAFSVARLDGSLAVNDLARAFTSQKFSGIKTGLQSGSMEDGFLEMRDQYLHSIRSLYQEYRSNIQNLSTSADLIPQLRLPRPPAEIANDPEVNRRLLAYWRGADELKETLDNDQASIPASKRQKSTHDNGSQHHQKVRQDHRQQNKSR